MNFQFGLETEYLLLDLEGNPLWWNQLSFDQLNKALEEIPFEDLPGSFQTMDIESPHKKMMPFVVEGYHESKSNSIHPKGVEIRTPVCDNLVDLNKNLVVLYERLSLKLIEFGLRPCHLSHHPLATSYQGPQEDRPFHWWKWAEGAMTTYGPDINISLPKHLRKTFSPKNFESLLNAYAPALAALSSHSPIYRGELWRGPSIRTWKRSLVAPAWEWHPDEDDRIEFKIFEMSPYVEDYEYYFLFVLTLLLGDFLKRDSFDNYLKEMKNVALMGLKTPGIIQKLEEIVLEAERVLPMYGFSAQGLRERIYWNPSTKIWKKFKGSMNQKLLSLSPLRSLTKENGPFIKSETSKTIGF